MVFTAHKHSVYSFYMMLRSDEDHDIATSMSGYKLRLACTAQLRPFCFLLDPSYVGFDGGDFHFSSILILLLQEAPSVDSKSHSWLMSIQVQPNHDP